MVENESLWQAAARCHKVLAAAEIPHAVVGGVAVYSSSSFESGLIVHLPAICTSLCAESIGSLSGKPAVRSKLGVGSSGKTC